MSEEEIIDGEKFFKDETLESQTLADDVHQDANDEIEEKIPLEEVTRSASTRARKSVDKYIDVAATKDKDFVVEKGGGIALGDYPFFAKALEKFHGDSDLAKNLHNLLYGSMGKKTEVKKHIRLFSGFPKGKKDEKLTRVLENKKKWTVNLLKDALGLIGLEKGGNREVLAERFIDYLMKPTIIKREAAVTPSKTPAKKSAKRRRETKKGGQPLKKRAPSAFILYSSHIRSSIKADNPDASFQEIAQLVGKKWLELTAEERAEWNDQAAVAKAALGETEDAEENGDEEQGGDDVDDDGAEDDFKDLDEEENAPETESKIGVEA